MKKSKYRYPGIRPFCQEEQEMFFGRDTDINNLCSLIKVENHVVLYGKSGYGKSSLLNAGIIPFFSNLSQYQVYNIRFGSFMNEKPSKPLDTLLNAIQGSSSPSGFIYEKLLKSEEINGDLLWYILKDKQLNSTDNKIFFLIFDQFEELFQYPESQIEEFTNELTNLLNVSLPKQLREVLKSKLIEDSQFLTIEESEKLPKPINIKILFSIRADNLSLLNRLSGSFPNILKKCYELGPLSEMEAVEAIQEPTFITNEEFFSPNFSYDSEALHQILNFLTSNGTHSIETFILQFVCQYIEMKVINEGFDSIDLENIGDLQEISRNYYNKIISEFIPSEQPLIRAFIEDKLIIAGRRISLDEAICEQSVSKQTLDKLYNLRLIRREKNSVGSFSYEISHDSLIRSIQESRQSRLEEERIRILEAEKYEELFLQKEIETKKRKKLRKILIIFLVVIAFLATLTYYFLYSSIQSKNYAEEIIKKKTDLDKLTAMLYYKTFVSLANEGNYPQAADFLQRIVNNYEDSNSITLQLYEKRDTTLYKSLENLIKGRISPADSIVFDKRINEYSLISKEYYKADSLLRSGESNYYKALELYKNLSEKDTDNYFLKEKIRSIQLDIKFRIRNYLTEANEYFEAEGYDEAKKEIKKILKLDPDNKSAKLLKKRIKTILRER